MATPLEAGSPRVLRRLNSALVLRAIRTGGPVSRAEIARETGLSKPTVNEVVELLLRAGYVRESLPGDGDRPRRPGPRARLLRFRADLGHVLGIDIGADKILVLVADLAGEIVASERRRTSNAHGADAVLREVRSATRAALARAGIDRGRLQAVGVGTPGVVDSASGRVALAPQLGGWEAIPLGRRLGRSFPCPVFVENEVGLSVLAERWRGSAQGIDEAIYVQVGVGIGAGILIGGELYRGASGAAGEIGYLPFPDDRASADGLGPFEHAAGGHAYARLGRAAAERADGLLLRELAGGNPDAIDAEVVFAAAERDDPAALAIVEELVDRLGRGIAAAVVVLNPQTVIVGGGVSRAGAALLEPLERRLRELVPVAPRLVLSSLGDEAVALGGVRLAIQHADERLFAFNALEAS